jgi:hypothetical protein
MLIYYMIKKIIFVVLIALIIFVVFNLHESFAPQSFKDKYITDDKLSYYTSIDITNIYNDIFNNKDIFERVVIVDPKTNCIVRISYKGQLSKLSDMNSLKFQLGIFNSISNVQIDNKFYDTDVIINLNKIYFILLELGLYKIYDNDKLNRDTYDSISNIKKSARDSLNYLITEDSLKSYFDINILTVLHSLFYNDVKKLKNDNTINIYALAAISNSFIDTFLNTDSVNLCNLKKLNICIDDLMNTFNFMNINTITKLKNKLSSLDNIKNNVDVIQSISKIDIIIDKYNKIDNSKIELSKDGSVIIVNQ